MRRVLPLRKAGCAAETTLLRRSTPARMVHCGLLRVRGRLLRVGPAAAARCGESTACRCPARHPARRSTRNALTRWPARPTTLVAGMVRGRRWHPAHTRGSAAVGACRSFRRNGRRRGGCRRCVRNIVARTRGTRYRTPAAGLAAARARTGLRPGIRGTSRFAGTTRGSGAGTRTRRVVEIRRDTAISRTARATGRTRRGVRASGTARADRAARTIRTVRAIGAA